MSTTDEYVADWRCIGVVRPSTWRFAVAKRKLRMRKRFVLHDVIADAALLPTSS
jgi:hypothetical protein